MAMTTVRVGSDTPSSTEAPQRGSMAVRLAFIVILAGIGALAATVLASTVSERYEATATVRLASGTDAATLLDGGITTEFVGSANERLRVEPAGESLALIASAGDPDSAAQTATVAAETLAGSGDARIVGVGEPASVPLSPVAPDRLRYVLGGIVIGALLGTVLQRGLRPRDRGAETAYIPAWTQTDDLDEYLPGDSAMADDDRESSSSAAFSQRLAGLSGDATMDETALPPFIEGTDDFVATDDLLDLEDDDELDDPDDAFGEGPVVRDHAEPADPAGPGAGLGGATVDAGSADNAGGRSYFATAIGAAPADDGAESPMWGDDPADHGEPRWRDDPIADEPSTIHADTDLTEPLDTAWNGDDFDEPLSEPVFSSAHTLPTATEDEPDDRSGGEGFDSIDPDEDWIEDAHDGDVADEFDDGDDWTALDPMPTPDSGTDPLDDDWTTESDDSPRGLSDLAEEDERDEPLRREPAEPALNEIADASEPLVQQLVELSEENAVFRRRIVDERERIAEERERLHASHNAELTALRAELDRTRATLDEVQHGRDHARSQLQDRVAELEAMLAARSDELERARATALEAAQRQADDDRDATAENAFLRAEVERYQNTLDEERVEHSTALAAARLETQDELDRIHREHRTTLNRLAHTNRNLLTSQRNDAERALADLEAAHQTALDRAHADYEERLRNAREHHQHRLDTAEARLRREVRGEARAELAELRERLDQASTDRGLIEQQLSLAKDNATDSERRISEARAEADRAIRRNTDDLARLRNRNRDLEIQLERAEKRLAEERKRTSEVVRNLLQESATTAATAESARLSQVEESQQTRSELEAELEDTRARLRRLEDVSAAREAELEATIASLRGPTLPPA